jgi:NADH:ubiquinone oxidoreductase subunit F (NADH-binding)
MTPAESSTVISKFRPAPVRAAPLPDRQKVVSRRGAAPPAKSTSAATPNEGDPGAFMTVPSWKAIRNACARAMAIAAMRSAPIRAYLRPREYPIAVKRLEIAILQAHDYGLLGEISSAPDSISTSASASGAGAFGLRRGNRADELHRRQPRRTARAASVPGCERPVRQATILNNVETYPTSARSS